MKPIKFSGWYHAFGEKLNHHYQSATTLSACGKVNKLVGKLSKAHSNYLDDRMCGECKVVFETIKEPKVTWSGLSETYYTKSTCPDCKADCVIMSSNPNPEDRVHIHVGCPAND